MYYYINGKLFIPESSNSGGVVIPAINYVICLSSENTFEINANDGIDFHFENGIAETGIITLNQSDYDSCHVFDNHAHYVTSELWDDGIYHTTWYYTQNGTGEINITYL